MVKVNLRPVGDYRGSGSIYRVRSASNPMGYHFVCVIYEMTEGTCKEECQQYHGTPPCPDAGPECGPDLIRKVECSCTGFQIHNNCWHEEKVIEWEEARLELGD